MVRLLPDVFCLCVGGHGEKHCAPISHRWRLLSPPTVHLGAMVACHLGAPGAVLPSCFCKAVYITGNHGPAQTLWW
jgi:hypothetical protein